VPVAAFRLLASTPPLTIRLSAAVAVASGTSANFYALINLAQKGDNIVRAPPRHLRPHYCRGWVSCRGSRARSCSASSEMSTCICDAIGKLALCFCARGLSDGPLR
jgi:hypothetical protein